MPSIPSVAGLQAPVKPILGKVKDIWAGIRVWDAPSRKVNGSVQKAARCRFYKSPLDYLATLSTRSSLRVRVPRKRKL
jgi:hypothetical protein